MSSKQEQQVKYYYYKNYDIELIELKSLVLDCKCNKQLCRGKYIKTRENQKSCLWSHIENNLNTIN